MHDENEEEEVWNSGVRKDGHYEEYLTKISESKYIRLQTYTFE